MNTAATYNKVPKGLPGLVLLPFHCTGYIDECLEEWDGTIKRLVCHGSHYEIDIQSRSGITVIIGKYTHGGFLSIPAYGIGSELASFGDYFWNLERLLQIINPVDAITIAKALKVLEQNHLLEIEP